MLVNVKVTGGLNVPELAKRLFFICSPERQMSQNKPLNRDKITYTMFIQY